MKVLITGTSRGIGRAAALKYLSLGHEVHGIDMLDSDICHPGYFHHIADIRREETLPEIENVEILFNNAGMQQSGDDIEANLTGAINITEKILAGSRVLKSILFNASASSLSGQEFPRYAAAKAGLAGYMRNVAIRTAPKGIT